jgi:hypothetical protein
MAIRTTRGGKKGKKDNKKGKILARLCRGARRRKKENWGVRTKNERKKHRAKTKEKGKQNKKRISNQRRILKKVGMKVEKIKGEGIGKKQKGSGDERSKNINKTRGRKKFK